MMSVKRDWKTYLLFVFSLCPFTSSFYMNPNDHITGTTNHNKYVEKYQLLGELRDYCDSGRDCREYAYTCNRNLCECAEGYRADDKNKTCVGGVGAKCHYDSHCIENAFCRHQLLCFCKKDYWMTSDDHWSCKAEWESKGTRLTGKLIIPLLVCYFNYIKI